MQCLICRGGLSGGGAFTEVALGRHASDRPTAKILTKHAHSKQARCDGICSLAKTAGIWLDAMTQMIKNTVVMDLDRAERFLKLGPGGDAGFVAALRKERACETQLGSDWRRWSK